MQTKERLCRERQEASLLWSSSHNPSQSLRLQRGQDDRPEITKQLGSTPLKCPQAIPGCHSMAPTLCTVRQEHTGVFGCSSTPGCRGGASSQWVSLIAVHGLRSWTLVVALCKLRPAADRVDPSANAPAGKAQRWETSAGESWCKGLGCDCQCDAVLTEWQIAHPHD